MFFKEEKLRHRTTEIEEFRYKKKQPISGWMVTEDIEKNEKYPSERNKKTEREFLRNDRWEGRDYYLWITTQLSIPENIKSEQLVLLFDFGRTGGGHNSGFESLLFINNEPYQAVDSNHKEVFIDEQYYGETIEISLRLWSGLEGGGPKILQTHQFKQADIAIFDKEIDEFYYTSTVLLDTLNELEKENDIRAALLNALDESYKLIRWNEYSEKEFSSSIHKANSYLQEKISELPNDSLVTITAIGHTHIDVAWLWRLKHTREKAARSFSTVLRLMEQYPDYIFLQTQPQLYEYIKEDYPEIFKKITERIKKEQWEVEGAMWLEADCNLPSGESFVRQILYGSHFIKNEFGKDTKYLWLPDVFGYSWALPQILRKSGIETFMTTKISWNQYNRMPHDTFIWKGIDGSEILTHFVTTPEIENNMWFYTYNGLLEPKTAKGIYTNYRDKNINPELLLSYGYGDGGGGVNREMLEKRRIIDKMPGLPRMKTGTAGEYFKKLHETFESTDEYVHKWDGELYLEYHRGTYTSQAYVKKNNRKLEILYRELEIIANNYLSFDKMKEVHSKLEEGWKIILRNQFHDIIPGSSIEEVYADNKVEYNQAYEIASQVEKMIFKSIENKPNTWSVFNNNSWVENFTIYIDEQREGIFIDQEKNKLESLKLENGYQVVVNNVEPLSFKEIKFEEKKIDSSITDMKLAKVTDLSVETDNYYIEWNKFGELVSIKDLVNQREVLTEKGRGNYFKLYEDKPMDYDAWDIDLYYVEKFENLKAKKIKVIENNALFTKVEFYYEFGKSNLLQEMILEKDNRNILFKTKVDWKERQQLLKSHFDIDVRSTKATYDIQFGNVERPTHWNTSWDQARFESVAHQWIDYSEADYGVSLLNDCKYGHSVKDQTMTITLLKGAIYPDIEADVGNHEFTYSLLPHSGDYRQAETQKIAWKLNSPAKVIKGSVSAIQKLVVFNSDCVIIDAIKLSENKDSIIVRVHENQGIRGKVKIRLNKEIDKWIETNLIEDHSMFEEQVSPIISCDLNPFEIKTFKLFIK